MAEILKVSELNEYLKHMFDSNPRLENIYVRGELSNYKVYPSGHHYFTMKDEGGAIKCVMFRTYASRLRFAPQDGMKVIALGRVSVYPRDGAYQLYATAITPEGLGDLQLAFQQLRDRLEREGLFDPRHKRPIPAFPMRVGIVTSSAGAAVHDIIRVMRKRWPVAKLLLLPVRVQGEEAPPEIAAAIRYANRHDVADVLIVGRGGGSMEDLWAFNDERVARAIYDSRVPVISAVGHEPDFTISDFVADMRAATPSNGAERCSPNIDEVRAALRAWDDRAANAMERRIKSLRDRLNASASNRILKDPMNYVDDRRLALDSLTLRLMSAGGAAVSRRREQFAAAAAKLDALSPLKVLGRGYSIALRTDGAIIKSAGDVETGDVIKIRMKDDEIACKVL